MFDTNEKINKIIGGQPTNNPFTSIDASNKMGNMSGVGFGSVQQNVNSRINPSIVINELQKLLDKMPEIRKAKGTLNVEFSDGTHSAIQLNYR